MTFLILHTFPQDPFSCSYDFVCVAPLHDFTRRLQNQCFKCSFHACQHLEDACGKEVLGLRRRGSGRIGAAWAGLWQPVVACGSLWRAHYNNGMLERLEATGWRLQAELQLEYWKEAVGPRHGKRMFFDVAPSHTLELRRARRICIVWYLWNYVGNILP